LARHEEDGARLDLHIRPFERRYEAAARDLFVLCIREIAPPSLGTHLDAYIAAALEGDYRDIAGHYRPGRGRGFWLAFSPAGDLLGTFGLRPCRGDAVELRRMYVDGAARRRGIASAMLRRAEADAAHWGFGSLFLTTSSLNRAAIQLYRSAGYRQSEYVPPDGMAEPLPPGLRIFAFEKSLGAA
jgi:GNAT superfamily N-acetyltransferase